MRACEICANLCTDTNAVSDLNVLDFGADLDGLANDLVAYAEGEWDVGAPASTDLVDIGGADTASINGDIDVMILKFLEGNL